MGVNVKPDNFAGLGMNHMMSSFIIVHHFNKMQFKSNKRKCFGPNSLCINDIVFLSLDFVIL